MFTLPVTTSANILAKLFSSIIWVLASLVVFVLSILLMTLTTADFPSISELIKWIVNAFDKFSINPILLITEALLLFLLIIAANILLIYLAMERDRPWTRDRLAALFWPDAADIAARNNLRQSLFLLRRALGPAARRQSVGARRSLSEGGGWSSTCRSLLSPFTPEPKL